MVDLDRGSRIEEDHQTDPVSPVSSLQAAAAHEPPRIVPRDDS